MQKRWVAKITYRRSKGKDLTVVRRLEELEELQAIVEAGPNFYAIKRITIEINDVRSGYSNLTLEEAELL